MKLQTDKILSQQNDIERQQRLLDEQIKTYRSQKTILYILVITLLIAILLGTLVYLSFRRNKRITKSLRAKNKEILFQQNKLIELTSQAREATETKLNFFTNISHEFRTPLTLIFGALEEITENKRYKKDFGNQLSMIEKNANKLYHLVNQLIDYRKMDVNKMKLQASENDISIFLKEIISSFRGLAQKRNIDLQFYSKKLPIMLWFDAYMLDKVFFNLLSNAFKFTEDYGKITLSIQPDKNNDAIIIDIEDNGKGITDDEAKHIFESFYQGKHNRNKGFGLGLPLAKKFIELHHGSLSLIKKESSGAIFSIILPTGKKHLSREEINENPSVLKDDKDQFLFETTISGAIPESNYNQDNLAKINSLSILVIEDNEELLNFLSNRLSKDFEVYTAKDGDSGLKKAFETIPDLIICDIVMPNKDGILFTQMIKDNIRTSHIPVILLTARSSEEQEMKGMEAMADYYITKPFKFQFLKTVINTLVKNRKKLSAHYTTNPDFELRQNKPGKLDRQFLNELNAFIDENIDNENLSIEDISRHIGVSRVQLYRKVNALLECSVNDLLLSKRLNKAKSLLADGSLSISEISYQVGFSSPSYFSTAFKKRFNISPAKWGKGESTS